MYPNEDTDLEDAGALGQVGAATTRGGVALEGESERIMTEPGAQVCLASPCTRI